LGAADGIASGAGYRHSKERDCVFRKLNALALFSVPLLPITQVPVCRRRRVRRGLGFMVDASFSFPRKP
jgi:hypothetical protein